MSSKNESRRRVAAKVEEANGYLWKAVNAIDEAKQDLEVLNYHDRFKVFRNMITSIRQKLWSYEHMNT